MKAESQRDQPRQFASYSERCPTQRELPGAAHCGPEELKGPSLVPLFIGSQDDWLQALVIFHPGHNPHDADSNYTILVLPRMYSSAGRYDSRHQDFQVPSGTTWLAQLTLLYKDKESAKSSQFTAHQPIILAVQARIQCWLVWDCQMGAGLHHHTLSTLSLISKVDKSVLEYVSSIMIIFMETAQSKMSS